MNAEERNDLSLSAFLGPETETIKPGLELRPLGLGTFSVLTEIKNEFFLPRGAEGRLENELQALLEYAYVHAGPETELRRAYGAIFQAVNKEQKDAAIAALKVDALCYGNRFTPADLSALGEAVKRNLSELQATGFEVQEKPGAGTKEPGIPPNS